MRTTCPTCQQPIVTDHDWIPAHIDPATGKLCASTGQLDD